MVHGVVGGIAVVGHLLGVHPVRFDRSGDIGSRAGQADHTGMKTLDVGTHFFGRVAGRIDRNKHRRDFFSVRAKLIKRRRDDLQSGRTDVGTECVAEEHEQIAPPEVLVGDGFAGLVDQVEWSANQRSTRADAFAQRRGTRSSTSGQQIGHAASGNEGPKRGSGQPKVHNVTPCV